MGKINYLIGTALKLVAGICLVIVSFYYCLNAGNGRYSYQKAETGERVFDSKTGLIIVVGSKQNAGNLDEIASDLMRVTINPFAGRKEEILKSIKE
jgi:hypothetical protein